MHASKTKEIPNYWKYLIRREYFQGAGKSIAARPDGHNLVGIPPGT